MARHLVAATVALAAVASWDHLLDPYGVVKATVVVVGALLVLVVGAVEVLQRPTIVVRGPKVVLLLLDFAAIVLLSTALAPHPVSGGRPGRRSPRPALALSMVGRHGADRP